MEVVEETLRFDKKKNLPNDNECKSAMQMLKKDIVLLFWTWEAKLQNIYKSLHLVIFINKIIKTQKCLTFLVQTSCTHFKMSYPKKLVI